MLGDSGGAQKNVNVAVSSRSPHSRSPSPGRDGTGRDGRRGAKNESCPARACAGRGVSAHGGGCGGAAWLSRGPPQPPCTAGGSSNQETGTEGSEGSESERTAWTLPRGHVLPPLPPAAGCTAAFRSPSPPELRELLHGTHSLMSATWAEGQGREGRVSERGRGGRRPAAGPTCSARRLPWPESLLCFVLLNLSVWCCIKSTVRELLPGRSS